MNKKPKDIVIVILHFGDYPWYFNFFIHSCGYNSTIDFLIISDKSYNNELPANITIVKKSFAEIRRLFSSKLKFNVALSYPYKLCDFKPTFGLVFSELIKGYKFWGYADIDVIFGNIRAFITRKILDTHDLVSVRHDYLTGYFQLFRNVAKVNNLFKHSRDYKKVFTSHQHFCFDETNFTWGLFSSGIKYTRIFCEVESMTHVVFRLKDRKYINPYFDFHVVEAGVANLKWEKGELTYYVDEHVFEILLYHMVDFKHIFKPKIKKTKIPEVFYITPKKIHY